MFLWIRRMQLRQHCGKFSAGNIVYSTQNLQSVAKVILLPEKVFQISSTLLESSSHNLSLKICDRFPQSFGSKFIKLLKNTRSFRNQTIPPNVPLEASTAVATTLTESFRGKSILFCSKSEYKYNHIMLRKFVLLSLFLSVQRSHFWQNFRHFFDERPQIFGSESKKMCAEGETFQKLHFASLCCSWHVECSCNSPAETFALNVKKFLLNHRKKDPVFVEHEFFFKRFLWKNWLQLQHCFRINFAGCLKLSCSKYKNKLKHLKFTLNHLPQMFFWTCWRFFFTTLLEIFG